MQFEKVAVSKVQLEKVAGSCKKWPLHTKCFADAGVSRLSCTEAGCLRNDGKVRPHMVCTEVEAGPLCPRDGGFPVILDRGENDQVWREAGEGADAGGHGGKDAAQLYSSTKCSVRRDIRAGITQLEGIF